MNLRTSMVAAGALLAILAPSAAAHSTPKTSTKTSAVLLTENSNGASLPQTRHVATKIKAKTKAKKQSLAKHSAPTETRVVPPMIIVPAATPVANPVGDGDNCENAYTGCTEQELCEIWGLNCLSDDSSGVPTSADPSTTASGQTDSGQTASGQTASGQTDSGQTDSGQTDSGQLASGQTASGQTASGN